MITTKDNLFNAIGSALSNSTLDELYLTAGATFEASWVTPEIQRVIEVAAPVARCSTASGALAAHYNFAGEVQTSRPAFCDDCGGVVITNNVAVEFSVRKIGDSPVTYRVLFTRVDAGRLAVEAQERFARLEQRVAALESSRD